MIWLLPHPPLSSVSCPQIVSRPQTFSVSPVELTDGRGRRGWGRTSPKRNRESMVLYKSFNTLFSGGATKPLCCFPLRCNFLIKIGHWSAFLGFQCMFLSAVATPLCRGPFKQFFPTVFPIFHRWHSFAVLFDLHYCFFLCPEQVFNFSSGEFLPLGRKIE
jgi:hypothetical protein